jgi:signal transduction histidine kinase
VRQVIRNLITNSLRYGGEHIEVHVGGDDSIGWVVVADDGPGLRPGSEESAFLPYQQGAPRQGMTASLGIGLPISRTIARIMNGDVTYERVDGETRFTFSLPLADPVTAPARGASGAGRAGILGRHHKR